MPLKQDCLQPVPLWLAELSPANPAELKARKFPLMDVLQRSLYYPASGFDGRPVQLLGGFVHSFVYADYGFGKEHLEEVIAQCGFTGYDPAGRRAIIRTELAPADWRPVTPHGFAHLIPRQAPPGVVPYAEWVIFDRHNGLDDNHGPSRFSLLYICGDGVATYQALYTRNNIAPLVLAVIQPGTGFGGNWTDFSNENDLLGHVVLSKGNSTIVPEFMVCGMSHKRPENSFWPNAYPEHVENWYQLGVWKRRAI